MGWLLTRPGLVGLVPIIVAVVAVLWAAVELHHRHQVRQIAGRNRRRGGYVR